MFRLVLENTCSLSRRCVSEHSYRNIRGIIFQASLPRTVSHITGRETADRWPKPHIPGSGVHVCSGEDVIWPSRAQRSNIAKTLKNRQQSRSKPTVPWCSTCKNKFWFAFSGTNLVRLGSSALRRSPARRTIKQSRQRRLEVVPHRHRRVFGRQTNLLSDSSVSSQGSAEDAKPKSDVPAG